MFISLKRIGTLEIIHNDGPNDFFLRESELSD